MSDEDRSDQPRTIRPLRVTFTIRKGVPRLHRDETEEEIALYLTEQELKERGVVPLTLSTWKCPLCGKEVPILKHAVVPSSTGEVVFDGCLDCLEMVIKAGMECLKKEVKE